MYKLIILLLLPIFLLGGNIVYSLQIATFSKLEKAQSFKNINIKKLKKIFLYKTDSGYWTVRYGQESRKSDIQSLKESSKIRLLKRGIIVPTAVKKLKKRLKRKKQIKKIAKIMDIDYQDNNKIDTFTFNIKVGSRIYVMQFGDFPFSNKANSIFNKKPTSSQLNTVILSSGNKVLFSAKLKRLNKSLSEIEKVILPILNKGRKDDNIRVKAFKLKY